MNPEGAVPQPVTAGQPSQAPKVLGAFDAPSPSRKDVTSAVKNANPVPENAPSSVVLNPSTGATARTQPVSIPETEWSKPVLVDKAKGSKAGFQKAVVTFVKDGDTADIRTDTGNVVCRIDSIDAPETAKPSANKPGQPYGQEAADTLKKMIEKKEVDVRVSYPLDKHGRAICQIEINGENINRAMVEQGMAWVYERYALDPSLKGSENAARTEKRGLWADPMPINPEVFRRSLNK